ncbi:cyclase family protein [Zooshikella sp. RANM57]|uniref:cyclase family protein n=1 Tax=Zooshikella sp. RANM57 TaxID=3425863 RepID=UPI003D6EDE92
MPKLVDLSVAIDPDYWEPDPVKRKVIDHKRGADRLGSALVYLNSKNWMSRCWEWLKWRCGWGMNHKDFPDHKGLSLMFYHLSTHTGTHMDAPYHYGDVNQQGQPQKTITDIPLEWCYGQGLVIAVSHDVKRGAISLSEMMQAITLQNLRVEANDIVFFHTGADKYQGTPHYYSKFRGISREATDWLISQGVKVIGIDSFSFDPPFADMVTHYLETGNKSVLWPAHMLGREKEYCQLERLANLDQLPIDKKFKVSCFPIKLEKADAAWCRVVAILDEEVNCHAA